MAKVPFDFSEKEVNLLVDAIDLKIASIVRSINANSDNDLKLLFVRKREEMNVIRSKFMV